MRIIGCLLVMTMVLVYPQATANASREALSVFAHDIVPTLYPYMILTKTLAEKLKEKKRHSVWLAAVLGVLGGTPSGASTLLSIADKQFISRRTLYTICTLMGTISPMFLLNTVGSWLGQSGITVRLILSHFVGAAMSAIFVYYYLRSDTSQVSCNSSEQTTASSSPIVACIYSVLSIGGCLVFFSVISSLIRMLLPNMNGMITASIHSILEITGGLILLSKYSIQAPNLCGILCAAYCGFSGVSMLSQTHLFLKPFGVTMTELVLLGILRAFFSASIMAMLMIIH